MQIERHTKLFYFFFLLSPILPLTPARQDDKEHLEVVSFLALFFYGKKEGKFLVFQPCLRYDSNALPTCHPCSVTHLKHMLTVDLPSPRLKQDKIKRRKAESSLYSTEGDLGWSLGSGSPLSTGVNLADSLSSLL